MHSHAHTVVSSHTTSEGRVSYLRCDCGAWEVRSGTLLASPRPRPVR